MSAPVKFGANIPAEDRAALDTTRRRGATRGAALDAAIWLMIDISDELARGRTVRVVEADGTEVKELAFVGMR